MTSKGVALALLAALFWSPSASGQSEGAGSPGLIAELRGEGIDVQPASVHLYYLHASQRELWVRPRDADRSLRLASGVTEFVLSPDATRVVFVRSEGPVAGYLWRMPLDPETGLAAGPARPFGPSRASGLSFSPSGDWVAFVAADGPAGPGIVIVPAAGGVEGLLVSDSAVEQLRWSIDGMRLYYVSRQTSAGETLKRLYGVDVPALAPGP
jgi:hypothetical protein